MLKCTVIANIIKLVIWMLLWGEHITPNLVMLRFWNWLISSLGAYGSSKLVGSRLGKLQLALLLFPFTSPRLSACYPRVCGKQLAGILAQWMNTQKLMCHSFLLAALQAAQHFCCLFVCFVMLESAVTGISRFGTPLTRLPASQLSKPQGERNTQ
jgi:ABC-type transport system involved in cytochrome c biogenesis permease component